ncbi:hypothetical protein CPB83DRAFT_880427 [Crepidotus variabilis]|uniref:Uncharacterized protein n=1 Tax=Crepidotus variabilis TaxID=179855 RepID=A0A9P6EPK8_9AGAR|nr:hypothetical protein CPB83DRAFT_880427 [Crepidotus variabilis]
MESPKTQAQEHADHLPEIASVTTRSRHSSVAPQEANPQSVDPYGRPINCFPICNPVSSAYGGVESYARSLLFTGNGFPIFDVLGDRNRSVRYLQRGVGIGDVGILDPGGDFVFAFNIFADPDDPLHADDIPPEFEQQLQPEPSEVKQIKNHFPPGTVIASKGVKVTRLQDSPLQFTLSTKAREAGVLVLPQGASREDWNAGPELLQYLERHAVDWYQHICHNIKASVTTVPNGSIYLITGLDKAQSLSAVSIPGAPERSGKPLEMSYDGTDITDPWTMTGAASAEISNRQTDDAPFAVFLRGIRISLSNKLWRSNLEEIQSDEMPYYNLLSTPITGFISRLVRQKELILGVPSSALPGRQQILFHVSDVLAQVLLDENPEAEYAFIEDSTWLSHVSDVSDGTRPEILNLLVRVLSSYDAKADGKNVTFQTKTLPTEPTNFLGRLLNSVTTRRRQQQTEARIQKIFDRR